MQEEIEPNLHHDYVNSNRYPFNSRIPVDLKILEIKIHLKN